MQLSPVFRHFNSSDQKFSSAPWALFKIKKIFVTPAIPSPPLDYIITFSRLNIAYTVQREDDCES
jgi:hypothetical protein